MELRSTSVSAIKLGRTPEIPFHMKSLSEREKRRIRLDIINPLPGGNSKISLYHAERYVRRLRARIVDGKLLFLTDTPYLVVTEEIKLVQRTAAGYDRLNRVLALREIRRIPIVCAARALLTK